jgi:hypothetical protein
MSLVANGGTSWKRGRTTDAGSVVEQLTDEDEESMWSRSAPPYRRPAAATAA